MEQSPIGRHCGTLNWHESLLATDSAYHREYHPNLSIVYCHWYRWVHKIIEAPPIQFNQNTISCLQNGNNLNIFWNQFDQKWNIRAFTKLSLMAITNKKLSIWFQWAWVILVAFLCCIFLSEYQELPKIIGWKCYSDLCFFCVLSFIYSFHLRLINFVSFSFFFLFAFLSSITAFYHPWNHLACFKPTTFKMS